MKKLTFLVCLALAAVSFSFMRPTTTENVIVNDIQFKVINDTGAAFDYYANSQHLTINAGQSVGFSYPEGTVIYKWTNGAQGTAWFTVAETQHGHSYQLSALLQ